MRMPWARASAPGARRDARAPAVSARPVSVRGAVLKFMAATLVAMVALAVAGLVVQQRLGEREAIHDAKQFATLAGRGVVQPALTPALLAGDGAAIDRMDRLVRARLGDQVEQVKVWTADGRVVYATEPRLIGGRFPLDAEEVEALRDGRVVAELSDLSGPENRFERAEGRRLLEVYFPLRATDGTPLLFEIYQQYDSITSTGRRLWISFMPPLLGGLALLWLVGVPLAWSLARQLRASQEERERLLQQAIASSDLERRRIAADLHDGVVQHLAGTAYGLAAAAGEVRTAPPEQTEQALDEATEGVRQSIRHLRSLIVEIHPPNLRASGLAAALPDLVAPLAARGVQARIEVEPGLRLGEEAEGLLFRGAQEAIRNVLAHSDARSVDITVRGEGGVARLVVADDGRGIDAAEHARRRGEGHLGLELLDQLAQAMGGRLEIAPGRDAGTVLTLEVPTGA
ncbi:MAG: histidine kinase [Thermoleophilia bacterium]|jgi:signal transduction histidine kinase|nr:histidine kinase [Thermoleophilia bacterium]